MPNQEMLTPEPARTLRDSPTLQEGASGPAVTELQTLLARAGFSAGSIDGSFGAKTKAAVVAFQRARGLTADGIVGPRTWEALRGTAPAPVTGLRSKIVAEAHWGIANAAGIHYRQLRPMDGINQRHKLPLDTDCSGFVTLCYKWAGAGDPNGLGFNGQGYTGSLLSYLTPVSQAQVKPGDLVLWARNGKGEHVSMVLEPGSDPLLVSHGQESGPYTVRFSASNRSHAGASVHWLRLPSVDSTYRDMAPPALQQKAPGMRVSGNTDAPSEEGLQPEAGPTLH